MDNRATRMPREDICTTLAAERTIWINAPRDRVWQAVTTPEQLNQWYAPGSTWDLPSLKVGEKAVFHHFQGETLMATIDFLDPMVEFVLRWPPDQTYPELILVTTFVLEDDANGTRVTINECGYFALPADIRQDWVDGTNVGYGMSLENLKALIEGRSIPHVWTPPSSQP